MTFLFLLSIRAFLFFVNSNLTPLPLSIPPEAGGGKEIVVAQFIGLDKSSNYIYGHAPNNHSGEDQNLVVIVTRDFYPTSSVPF